MPQERRVLPTLCRLKGDGRQMLGC
ncbi:hypothetical protein MES5069_130071 [Mesorhizobium escarrei]|uniref:Uncharacterized protein n=1 Tax=Mesorhizobium escarrei TaxID=666018 RepID=A0ABM9DHR9_9HYPH|nr:hypothetical protein MES5069_130071 [Mesorhizobium escarrei]